LSRKRLGNAFDWLRRSKKKPPEGTGLPAIPPEPGLPIPPIPPAGLPAKPSIFSAFGPPALPPPPAGPPAPPLFAAFGPPEVAPPAEPPTFERLFPPEVPPPPPPAQVVDYLRLVREATGDYLMAVLDDILRVDRVDLSLFMAEPERPPFTEAEAFEVLRQMPEMAGAPTGDLARDAQDAYVKAFSFGVSALLSAILDALGPELERFQLWVRTQIPEPLVQELDDLTQSRALALVTGDEAAADRIHDEIEAKTPPHVLEAQQRVMREIKSFAEAMIARFKSGEI